MAASCPFFRLLLHLRQRGIRRGTRGSQSLHGIARLTYLPFYLSQPLEIGIPSGTLQPSPNLLRALHSRPHVLESRALLKSQYQISSCAVSTLLSARPPAPSLHRPVLTPSHTQTHPLPHTTLPICHRPVPPPPSRRLPASRLFKYLPGPGFSFTLVPISVGVLRTFLPPLSPPSLTGPAKHQ